MRLGLQSEKKSTSNTHLCCRLFLELLDYISETDRQVGQEAGVSVCVYVCAS